MKKVISFLMLFMIIGIVNSYSQQGYKAVYVAGGLTYEKGGGAIVGLDFPSNSYHSFEIVGQFFTMKNENNLLGGLSYKYCFSKSVNSMFRGKVGGLVGTTTHETIFSPVAGFEYIYALSPVVDFLWLTDGGYYFNSEQRWRVSTYVGFRLNF